jgi:hypothetical protein
MATVLADRKLVYGEYMLESGENIIATTPLTDDELLDYRRHPDTFFGVHAPQGRRIEGPLEIFDFFFSPYKNTPRETLLELLKTAPDFDELRKLGQKDLVEICCERRTYSVLRSNMPLNQSGASDIAQSGHFHRCYWKRPRATADIPLLAPRICRRGSICGL